MNSRSADQSQRDRFEQAARELGVELDEAKLKEALRQMKGDPEPEGNHQADD